MTESTSNTVPLFNLSLVLRETGLKADVLRVWERRYGVPNPGRSAGGHRLYSRQDIDTVKWLQARMAEGMSIRRATDLWKELSTTGRDPLSEYTIVPLVARDHQPDEGLRLDGIRKNWLEACLVFDRHLADDTLNEALALFPVERICVEIFQQGLHEIGERWYQGAATVQQEHFVSAQVMRRVEALINATPDPTREQTIMLGCPPGELHTYPTLFLSLLLRRKGYKVVDLGADIPLDQMQTTIQAIKPDLVVMAAQQLTTAASILGVARLLEECEVAFAFGGSIFNRIPALRNRIPAHFLGENLEDSLSLIDSLLTGAVSLPVKKQAADDHRAILARFQENRPRIELFVLGTMQKLGLTLDQITDVNRYLGDRISAALAFGDSSLIEPDLEWLRGWHSTRLLHSNVLAGYLKAYSQILEESMGGTRDDISKWMQVLASRHAETHQ